MEFNFLNGERDNTMFFKNPKALLSREEHELGPAIVVILKNYLWAGSGDTIVVDYV